MTALPSILVLGFFLGMRHATDADHVIAVTTIIARHRGGWHAALIGAFWGIGHTLTILLVGGGILLLNWSIPARVGLSMEFSVGLMLIMLGSWNLAALAPWFRQAQMPPLSTDSHVHSYPNVRDEYVHSHLRYHAPEPHTHNPEETPLAWLDSAFGSVGFYQVLRPLIVGVVHGLAGSAAVALLVLATVQNAKWAMLYLVLFGVGTVVGMMLITVAIAVPFAYSKPSVGLDKGLRIVSGLISLGFGMLVVYQIGVGGGLFSGHPQWVPR